MPHHIFVSLFCFVVNTAPALHLPGSAVINMSMLCLLCRAMSHIAQTPKMKYKSLFRNSFSLSSVLTEKKERTQLE